MLYAGKILVTGTRDEVLASQQPELREFVETSGAVAMGPMDQPGPSP
jgi:ABC-type transporter Mla maintaining outer membrane lipid asymmetry ATPase subunit MlaF